MASTQAQLAAQMIAQLRLLDPSVSAEVGTPERKIIDTLAQNLFDNQIDLSALSVGLDVDGKYGAALDRFLNIFGFARRQATFATGFATFSRATPSTTDIRIPSGVTLQASVTTGTDAGTSLIRFTTVYDVILPAGALSVIAPIRANIAGSIGNVAANLINTVTGSPLYGITSVTNETATANGVDSESDEELKVRFKNTIFRNLAGTEDQYLALAVATAFTTRANVVGPQSNYREYIQVPVVDDSQAYDIDGIGGAEAGGGSAGQYTTALSTIPYAKYLWSANPVFVSNGELGVDTVFYRQDADFIFNTTTAARDRGDAHREKLAGIGPDPATGIWPNITLTNVYSGTNADVQAVRPSDVLLFEYSYLSNASRNDPTLNINNAVDVYIDGSNDTSATTLMVRPTVATAFVDNSTSKYHYENYRRIGQPATRPLIGNILTTLFWQPVTDVPDQITVGTNTYLKGVHYWGVTDISNLGGTIRARNGIEWSTTVFAKADTDSIGDPSTYTGRLITDTTGDPVGGQPVEIDDYVYDKNVVDLQTALVGAKQITTDVLAHSAKTRYLKLDLTAMYSQGSSIPGTNLQVATAIDSYLQSLYFGSVIQLSDLLQVAHSVAGIDNVRWTTDTPNSTDLSRVYEVDENGIPILGIDIQRLQPGTASRPEIQSLFINGQPTGGSFTLTFNTTTTASLAYNTTAATIQAQLRTATGDSGLVVTEDTRSTTGVTAPIRSFRILWSTNGARVALVANTLLTGGPFVINSDFFIRDDELIRLPTNLYTPTTGVPDTVPGLIIRPRAQNTWTVR